VAQYRVFLCDSLLYIPSWLTRTNRFLRVETLLDNIPKEILKLFAGATMNNFQIDMAFLHFIDFKSWGVLDNRPLYCITL
jgi:hypothetical protein